MGVNKIERNFMYLHRNGFYSPVYINNLFGND